MANWYKFEKGNPIGFPQVDNYQLCFYDNNECYDEAFFKPDEVAKVIPFITEPNCKIFLNFKNKKTYYLKLEEVKD